MFPFKKTTPEVSIEKTGHLLMVNLYVKNNCEAWMQCVIESDSSILIGDILHDKDSYFNKGHGSMMMERFITYARENGYTYIYGNLSIVDLDHKDRLHHFYEKFNFVISEYLELKGSYYGKIEKRL